MNIDEARIRFYAIQGEADRDDLRHTVITLPTGAMTKAQLKQLAFDNAAFGADIQQALGLCWEHAAVGLDALKDDPGPPPPPPGPTFVPPIRNGATFGVTKWLPGNGCDLFIPRGTAVVAPADCVIEEVIGGVGQSGGAEIILSVPDHSWSWRYRHVQSTLRVGQRVAQGQQVAAVYDTSLDQLCRPPVVNMLDGWQHLDLSVNQGTNQFSPQGGGGGNYNSYSWLTLVGYIGTAMARTPGPTDCQFSEAEAIILMTPAGRI